MDIRATGAANLYNYQSTAKSSSQSAAVLQVLAQTYGEAAASGSGLFASDALSSLAGTDQAMAALTAGVYSAAAANGNSSFPTDGLSSATIGGLDASSASSLLGGMGSTGTSDGLLGLSSTALDPSLAAAISSYQYQQSIGSGAGSTSDGAIHQVVQAAQSTQFSSTLNLLG